MPIPFARDFLSLRMTSRDPNIHQLASQAVFQVAPLSQCNFCLNSKNSDMENKKVHWLITLSQPGNIYVLCIDYHQNRYFHHFEDSFIHDVCCMDQRSVYWSMDPSYDINITQGHDHYHFSNNINIRRKLICMTQMKSNSSRQYGTDAGAFEHWVVWE